MTSDPGCRSTIPFIFFRAALGDGVSSSAFRSFDILFSLFPFSFSRPGPTKITVAETNPIATAFQYAEIICRLIRISRCVVSIAVLPIFTTIIDPNTVESIECSDSSRNSHFTIPENRLF